MMKIEICPSTLADGFNTYSPKAVKALFDGRKVSHIFPGLSPETEGGSLEGIRNIGRISLSGAQPKFSVVIGGDDRCRYSLEGEQGTHILKPHPTGIHIINKGYCAANEHVTMQIASQVYGIETAPNALIFFEDDEPAYITRRFDVYLGGKYKQEDFAALLGWSRGNGGNNYKYDKASYEECAEVIKKYVKAALVDLRRFFRLVLFNFVTLNDDAHLKNFSLIERGGEYRLSPAYDLVNTSLHLYEPHIFALDKGLFKEGMDISDTHSIGKEDFIEFGKRIGLPDKVVNHDLMIFQEANPKAIELIQKSFLSDPLKSEYITSYRYRCKMLTF
ncbi:MAG: HipA domain-containing protein [Candidatus Cryptobacteroides sp.]|nr:HipA domain-containing protein [Candidatus Cryptobacteroides sp.]MDY5782129.1 HipA domain-containing protein [Candidatus Cryptobacteroides sp.]